MEKSHNPQLSVVVCAYNRNQYMDAVFRTIQQQTLSPDEIIVVDDGSDCPVADPKINNVRIIRLPENGGLANARNVGIAAATSKYIAFLDTDDTWRPNKLELQMQAMNGQSENVFGVFCGFERHGRKVRAGVVITPQVKNWFHYFLMGIRCGPGSTLLFRREAALSSPKFDISMKRYEDWDWLLNITRSGKYSFGSIQEPLADVWLTGSPDKILAAEALDEIELRHWKTMNSLQERRLFGAAVSLERAAIARWSGNRIGFVGNALKALASPEIILRELKLTLNRGE